MSNPKRQTLVYDTELHIQIVREIDSFRKRFGYQPTLRELQDILHLKSVETVHAIVRQMKTVGLVDYVPNHVRTLHLLPDGRKLLK